MMDIRTTGFSSEECLSISAQSSREAGYMFGRLMADATRQSVPESSVDDKKRARTGLARLRQLAASGAGVIDGTDHLSMYLETFDGFFRGAGIDEDACSLIQSGFSPGCQTLIVGDGHRGFSLLHTEENVDDECLPRIHRTLESGWVPSLPTNHSGGSFGYRIVDWSAAGIQTTFFAYPGLCAGGSSVGVNRTTGAIFAVDFLNPVFDPPDDALWAEAVASVLFSVGTIQGARQFVDRLRGLHCAYTGGYAVQIVETSGAMATVEFGAQTISVLPPDRHEGHPYIAQTNYPRQNTLRIIDKYHVPLPEGVDPTDHIRHLGLSARGRTQRLETAACSFPANADPDVRLQELEILMAGSGGDWETDRIGGYFVNNGFVTPYLAGYVTAVGASGHTEVVFHKLAPPPIPTDPYTRWLPPGSPLPPHSRNLLEEIKHLSQRKEAQ